MTTSTARTSRRPSEQESIDRSRLGTYLNDHLAGSGVGLRLARRCAEENADNDFGPILQQLADEIEEEQKLLRRIISLLELPVNPLKKAAGAMLAHAGALKFNNKVFSYSPLSRLLELEALLIGVLGKRCLWQTLELVATEEPALTEFDFSALRERSDRQMSQLGQLRMQARYPALSQQEEAAFVPRYRGPERRSGHDRRVRPMAPGSSERRDSSERRADLS